jgi:hypothetical protein
MWLRKTEYNKTLYWRYLSVWLLGMLACVPFAALFAIVFRQLGDCPFIMPVTISIVFLPLVIVGTYGIKMGYGLVGPLHVIVRGKIAVVFNSIMIILYSVIVIFGVWGCGTYIY